MAGLVTETPTNILPHISCESKISNVPSRFIQRKTCFYSKQGEITLFPEKTSILQGAKRKLEDNGWQKRFSLECNNLLNLAKFRHILNFEDIKTPDGELLDKKFPSP